MKVLVFPADSYGCGYHRLIWPVEVLRAQGHDVQVVPQENRQLEVQLDDHGVVHGVKLAEEYDVVVLQRVTHRNLVGVIKVLRARGVAVVVDVDDDLSTIHPSNPAWPMLHPTFHKEGSAALHSWRNLDAACREATLVTATTPALVTRYAAHGRARVFPNYLAQHYYEDAGHVDSDVIGWPASLASHPNDPDAVGNAITRVVDDGGQFHVMSIASGVTRAFGIRDESRVTQVEHAVALTEWPREVAKIGIGIAPLADTKFNHSKCLDASTRIATRRGVVALSQLREGDEVQFEEQWRKVIALRAETPTTGLEIETRRGRKLRLTVDHRLRVSNVWKRADEMRIGDIIDGGRERWGDQDQYVTLPWPADSRQTRHVDTFNPRSFWNATHGPRVTIDEMWGRLLGLIIGDGNIAGSGAVTIALDAQDEDLAAIVMNDFKSIGLRATYRRNVGSGLGCAPAGGASISVTSAALVRFLELTGVAQCRKDTKSRCYTKTFDIPEVIWHSPRTVALAFIGGLFEADASGTDGVSLSTKSEVLARAVQQLLTSLGVLSTVKRRDVNLSYTKKDGTRDYVAWSVTILTRELDAIRDNVMISARKSSRLAASVSRRARGGSHGHGKIESINDEIVAITPCWLEPIDIQVDGEVLLVNGLVSHNSWLKPLEMSVVGVPWVGSPRVEYQRLHDMGCGVLCDKPSDWYKKLTALRKSASWRTELSEAGRVVASQLRLEDHAWKLWESWVDALAIERSGKENYGRHTASRSAG